MKLAIASDHAGFELKSTIKTWLESNEKSSFDFGTENTESCDYPDYVHPLAKSIQNGEFKMGILICGSANGVCMTANRYSDIRAALCWLPEIATLARKHNNANVLCLPARHLTEKEAIEILKSFINTEFEGGRHQRRVSKINMIHEK